jgi:CBS domain-containing protein
MHTAIQASIRQGGGGADTGVVSATTTTQPVGVWASWAPPKIQETGPKLVGTFSVVVVGYVEPTEFLAGSDPAADVMATGPLLDWIDDLDRPDRLDRLAEYPVRLAHLAGGLVATGVQAAEVGRVISYTNDALAVRLLRLTEARLGPPPCPYAWLVLGSGGRQEQALLSDQDNALVYATATEDATEYFTMLAQHVVAALHAAGFPPCPGGYMATTWRHTLDDWLGIFRCWVQRPEPRALVEAEVFLDFRRVHGQLSPWPLNEILGRGGRHGRFLIQMARAAVTFRPPVGLFGRVKARHDQVDLKRGGIAAIVLLARLYALAAGSVARPTIDRLAMAADAGTLTRTGAGRLAQAYLLLADLRLRAQLQQIAQGGQPDNCVRLDQLGNDGRQRLRSALRVVYDQQRATALRFRTDLVG